MESEMEQQPVHSDADITTPVKKEEPAALEIPPTQPQNIGNTTATTSIATASTTSRTASNKVPNHLRVRYWNSYEEVKLVELWRLHASEIVSLQQHTPVFRTIADAMKKYGFHVNPQECRRRICALNNRYSVEKQKLQLNNVSSSSCDWRLYPLVECVVEPQEKIPDLQHELRIVNRVLAQLAPSTCIATTIAAPNTYNNTSIAVPPTKTNAKPNPYKRLYNQRSTYRSAPLQSRDCNAVNQQQNVANEKGLNFLLKLKHHFIAVPTLEELRKSNQYLEMKRDYAKARLQIQESEYKLWQTQLTQWQFQQEQVLQRL